MTGDILLKLQLSLGAISNGMAVYPINFYDDVSSFFKEIELAVEITLDKDPNTIFLPELSLFVQCYSLADFEIAKKHSDPETWQRDYLQLISGTAEFIRIWEDIWFKHTSWIKQYFSYRKRKNTSIFARDLRGVNISKEIADHFLEKEHLLGKVQAKRYIGLVVPPHRQFRNITSDYFIGDQKLVGVAAFAKPMLMKEPGLEGQLSGELIRFCSILGTRIVGGLSKVIQYYHKEEKVNNIMTYIDLEWNRGEGYQSIGFQEVQLTKPILYTLNDLGERVICQTWEEASTCTAGNKKLRIYFSEN
ncbi:hypothetical protein PQG22_06815 [Aquirufa beregesia]